jgi:putative transposase
LLKKAWVYVSHFRTRSEARAARFEYSEVFDNRQRLHSARDYRMPQEAAVAARTA